MCLIRINNYPEAAHHAWFRWAQLHTIRRGLPISRSPFAAYFVRHPLTVAGKAKMAEALEGNPLNLQSAIRHS